ncbi:hypothetical protein [Bacillus sp. V33-4]|uniref:hypothetical protein n=1 Tax=Bacillus sp. V33-4 TaxID=2054169 RepID=UPI0015E0E3F4|nr:hypothetical protein [Bacillus sp. V33-4]
MKATNVSSQDEVQNKHVNAQPDANTSSKVGTWISVAVVGAVILGTYIVLYGLYMARV